MSDHDAIWAQTTDGGMLQQLFGHYPGIHDAYIRGIELKGTTLQIVADYVDVADEDRLAARMILEWTKVVLIDLPLELEHVISIAFSRLDNLLVTTLETWPGVFGQIRSDGFEAILSQLQPGNTDELPRFRFGPR